MIALVSSPLQAAAITLPILCAMDLFAVWTFRGVYSLPHLKVLLPSALVGIVLGSMVMGQMPASYMLIVIGSICIGFCIQHWLGLFAGSEPNLYSGYFWGIVSGFTSTQIHAGGPPVSVYMLPFKLDKFVLAGTFAIFFAAANYTKLIPYTLLGQFSTQNLLTSLVLLPLAPIGVKLGYVLLQRVSQIWVYRILYIFLFFAGIKLISDGLSQLT